MTKFFLHGSINDSSNLRKFEAKCRYCWFSENQRILWLWGRVLVKLNWILVFCLQLSFSGSLIFKFNHSKIKISSSRDASEFFLFIWLLPNVSYVIECISSKEVSVIFRTCQFFYIILVNFLLILSKYRSTLPPYRIKLNLWPIVWTEGFLAFVPRSFHTKFSDFCA